MHPNYKLPKSVRYRRTKGDSSKMTDKLASTILSIMTNDELVTLRRNIDVLLKDPFRKPRI